MPSQKWQNDLCLFPDLNGFQGKPFNTTVIQIYAPTNDAEVEWFYEDLQDLLEITPQKMSFSL